MKGFVGNIEKITLKNNAFRRVLHTDKRSQLVVMSLLPGEEIGSEVHGHLDQFFRIEAGKAKIVLAGKSTILLDGGSAVIPAKTRHNIINISKTKKLKLYTLYSPPEHAPGTVHLTKEDAEEAEKRKH